MGISGNPSAETRRQVYAEAAKLAHQLYLQLDKIADFEPWNDSIHDTDAYLGALYYNIDEVIAELRERSGGDGA